VGKAVVDAAPLRVPAQDSRPSWGPDKSSLVYNSRITLHGIPLETYRYILGSRSAVEWIIDRYQVKTDKASGIVNDPNDWSRDVENPRYILDLLARIVTVSLETMKVVDALPALEIRHLG
jgi:predicted helicase